MPVDTLHQLFLKEFIMNLPNQYKTGNAAYDQKVAAALAKDKVRIGQTRLERLIADNDGTNLPVEEKTNKYHVVDKEMRTDKDGTLFASKKEMLDYHDLLLVEKAGAITNLRCQVPFVLQESFYTVQYGKIEAITYVADFVYTNVSYHKGYPGREVIADSKSFIRTPEYRLKRKLVLRNYPNYLFFEI